MANKSFKQLFSEARNRDSYWSEKAKLQFTEELFQLMERRGVNKTQFAERIGSSPSYVTKALRGDVNLTVESMIKFVRAVDGVLELHVRGREDNGHWFNVVGHGPKTVTTGTDSAYKPVKEYVGEEGLEVEFG